MNGATFALAWADTHKQILDWIFANEANNTFAASLRSQFSRKGELSMRQVDAVQRIIDNRPKPKVVVVDIDRNPEQKYPHEVTPPIASLDLRGLPSGRYAVPGGDTRLKVKVRRITDDAPKWAGFIFVSDAAEYGSQKRYGMQKPNGFYYGQIVDELRKIAADPYAASVAYGKLTNTCGVCGRHLEDEESVARGIGPICAARMEWDADPQNGPE